MADPSTVPQQVAFNRAADINESLAGCLEILQDASRPMKTRRFTTLDKENRRKAAENALRLLFLLTESPGRQDPHRKIIARYDQMVPQLLNFVQICAKTGRSNELSLALLVLKNISTPMDNKRLIAFIYKGAKILGQLLGDDSSNYMIAIILANLTTGDGDLCQELASHEDGFYFIEALVYSLRVSSMHQVDLTFHQELIEGQSDMSIADRMRFMADEENHYAKDSGQLFLPIPSVKVYPETARWCLTILKNMTRPNSMFPEHTQPAHLVANSGVVGHLLRFITMSHPTLGHQIRDPSENSVLESKSSSEYTPEPVAPVMTEETLETFSNDPKTWDATSPQDAALFILMNLTLVKDLHDALREMNVVPMLKDVAEFQPASINKETAFETEIREFQQLKARISLGWIIGGAIVRHQGLGMPKHQIPDQNDMDSIVLSDAQVRSFVQILSDALHGRVIHGAPGTSRASLSLQCMLYSLRCLLTQYDNQIKFAYLAGPKLNTLLMKVLAMEATRRDSSDEFGVGAVEHTLYSLYLLSCHGFKFVFLPHWFMSTNIFNSLIGKILAFFNNDIDGHLSMPASHAVEQLMFRCTFLCYDELAIASNKFFYLQLPESDLKFPSSLLQDLREIEVPRMPQGATPLLEVHDRPIACVQSGNSNLPGWLQKFGKIPQVQQFTNIPQVQKFANSPQIQQFGSFVQSEDVILYPSALIAAQEFSFESKYIAQEDMLDDVQIANAIVQSANENKEAFHHRWRWGDGAPSSARRASPGMNLLHNLVSCQTSCGNMSNVYFDRPGT